MNEIITPDPKEVAAQKYLDGKICWPEVTFIENTRASNNSLPTPRKASTKPKS